MQTPHDARSYEFDWFCPVAQAPCSPLSPREALADPEQHCAVLSHNGAELLKFVFGIHALQ